MTKSPKILTLTVTYPYMCDGEPCTASKEVDFYYQELKVFFDNLRIYLQSISSTTTGIFNWDTFIDTYLSTLTDFIMSPVQDISIYYSFGEYQFKMRKINPI